MAILGADITIQNMVNTLVRYGVLLLVGCLAFSGIFLWLLYRWMKRRVIDPVQQLEAAARNFVRDTRQEASPEALHFAAPDIHTGDEIQMLSDALGEMSEDVKSYLTNLLTQTREKERIASELGVAAKIQSDMLPGIFPVFPQFDQFDLFASMDPAKEVEADVANLDRVNAFVEEQLAAYGCSPAAAMPLLVALEELFVNIAHYAYDGQPGTAEIQTDFREGTAILRFIDRGKPFDPLARKDPDVSKPAAKRQVGGLGIYMVKKTMDSVSYQRMDDRNVLTICKKIS